MRNKPENKPKRRRKTVYDQYREILEMPDLTEREIDEMRPHVELLAQTICEHVWDTKFY